jgi:nitroreductase
MSGLRRRDYPATTNARRSHVSGYGAAGPFPIPAEEVDGLLLAAGRAPSIHNTQPWRFRVTGESVDLFADASRRLEWVDPDGREMLISCGAALFGLRVAVRCLGYQPVTRLLPDPGQPELLARIQLGERATVGTGQRSLLAALHRRHTHRGPFTGEPLPVGLPVLMQRDAEAEGAALVVVRGRYRFDRLARLVAAADRRQGEHPAMARQLRAWTRPANSLARDGVPARAYPAHRLNQRGRLAQRDFDLGRGWGTLPTVPDVATTGRPTTAVLTTAADRPVDWLRAGQALHRLLLHAASNWVFATIHTQPLEIAPIRAALRTQLHLSGVTQMLLQLGRAGVAPLTPRRPVREMVDLT